MGIDQPLGLYDLVVDELVVKICTVGAVHDEPPDPALSCLYLVDGICEPVRAPPLRYLRWIGPRLPHALAGCVERPGESQFGGFASDRSIVEFVISHRSHRFPRGQVVGELGQRLFRALVGAEIDSFVEVSS